MLWTVYVLMAQFSVHAVSSYKGLVCTNDFINNVSCMWNSSDLNPDVDCLVSGVKKIWVRRKQRLITQSCKLVHSGNSVPGCSFVFENKEFSGSEVMPNISMKCNGTLVETINKYRPSSHIKMHPLAAPNISSTAGHVHMSWSLGPRVSDYFTSGFMFQVQYKQNHQTWREANNFFTQQQEEFISMEQLKGIWQFRVRVNPEKRTDSQWSQWSPTTSWVGPSTRVDMSPPEKSMYLITITTGLAIPLIVMGVVIFALYRCANTRGLLKGKPVPNPSEYFHTLHSVHEGNLKKWLNHSVPESFFTASPDHFSTVEVCESWDVSPSHSACCSSTSDTLHFQSRPSVGSNTSKVVDSSTSSSCFSNLGYFMSSSSESSDQTSPPPAYFTCEKDFRSFQSFISPPVSTCLNYERLKRGPHSPDSGFCTGNEDKSNTDVEMNQDLEDLSFPLIFPLHLQHLMVLSPSPSPSPPTLHQPFSPAQFSADNQQVEDPTANFEAWPVSDAMCRPSSMPVDSSKTGYLTIKELHATFSNKSI
ncbi:interleukin-2 receptor subunit beta-like [Gouania willdenowi]|uniref:Interleukin-2 receptor subunit beta-like n=1 Tax=Gouania willdenowi TaxID=441366 RepID=A0A8C5DR23_GOUWI|nr:interleukin-2 receptor subunit beta-like [Gouania willdenowi]